MDVCLVQSICGVCMHMVETDFIKVGLPFKNNDQEVWI